MRCGRADGASERVKIAQQPMLPRRLRAQRHWQLAVARRSRGGRHRCERAALGHRRRHNRPRRRLGLGLADTLRVDVGPHDGWQLLVKVLAEMIDAETASEQAAVEEDRHMVNKLLMLLGSNVTNRRERDARMQRALQEGSDATAERDTGGRRAGGSRRARVEESESIDIQQLHSILAFNIGNQHWHSASAFNIGIGHWHSTLAFNIGNRN